MFESKSLQIQFEIYQYMKERAKSFEIGSSKEFEDYKRDQEESSTRDFSSSSIEELLVSISKSQVVFLGDFHCFDQNSKNVERLLGEISNQEQKIILCVEFIFQQHQSTINDYINGYLTELEFLEAINYNQYWRFPWRFYRPFFEKCKKGEIEIRAINTKGTLQARDNNAANFIKDLLLKEPNSKLIVLFGEYHIIADKLPFRLKEILNTPIQSLIIHQNIDQIYWKLKKDKKQLQVVKFNNQEFSLQSSPPWAKYESLINWYENILEDPQFDIHCVSYEQYTQPDKESVSDYFYFFSTKLAEMTNQQIPIDLLEDFNIYDYQSLDLVLSKVEKLPGNLPEIYLSLIKKNRSFKLPFENIYYCPHYSLNRVATLAGIHIFDINLKKMKQSYEEMYLEKDSMKLLLFLSQLYAIGYLSSKMINPYRKCNLYKDILEIISDQKSSKEKITSHKTALALMENEPFDLNQNNSRTEIQRAAKIFGHALGERIFVTKHEFHNIYSKILSNEDFLELNNQLFSKDDLGLQEKRLF